MTLGRVYQPATACTKGSQPGTRALAAWVLGAYGELGARNLGIYNCRPIRGTNRTTSLHGEGRAWDAGFAVGDPDANVLANALVAHSQELGIQCVIYERLIWSARYPDSGWRKYNGTNPHLDHLHIEQTWVGANNLTVEAIEAILHKPAPQGAPVRPPLPAAEPGDALRKGDHGPEVARLQRDLQHLGFMAEEDGSFGPDTEKHVKAFQVAAGIAEDGVAGPETRRYMGMVGKNGRYPGHSVPSRQYNEATKRFQQRLKDRTWTIGVDGYHGDQTSKVFSRFQSGQKGLTVDGKGGPQMWTAIWARPVT